jgi:hypothetical protein
MFHIAKCCAPKIGSPALLSSKQLQQISCQAKKYTPVKFEMQGAEI